MSEHPENLAGSDDELEIFQSRFERIGVLVDHLVHLVLDRELGVDPIERTVLFLNQELHDTDDERSRLNEWLQQQNKGGTQ